MKKILFTLSLTALISCVNKEKYDKATINIKIEDRVFLKMGRFSNDFYIIDEKRNIYQITGKDFARLRVGDSLKINNFYATEILEIYEKSNK